MPSVLDGEPQQLREYHEGNLGLADGVLLYWGAADELWLRLKMQDLLRIRGLSRTAPFKASAVYLADPQIDEKREFVTREATVIRHSGDFLPDTLVPFVTALNAAPQ